MHTTHTIDKKVQKNTHKNNTVEVSSPLFCEQCCSLGRHLTKSERPAPPFPKSSDNGIVHDDDKEDAQDNDYDHDNDPDSGHDNGHDNCHDNDHYFSDHLCIKMSKYFFQHKVKISDQK